MKRCPGCGETKDPSGFYKNRCQSDGLHTHCKSCAREQNRKRYAANKQQIAESSRQWRMKNRERDDERRRRWCRDNPVRTRMSYLLRTYGLTAERYNDMLQQQENRCAICFRSFGNTPKTGPHVDHDHTTRQVRQLLCNNCNALLGYAQENSDILLSAVHYLRDHSHQDVTYASR